MHEPVVFSFLIVNECKGGRIPFYRSLELVGNITEAACNSCAATNFDRCDRFLARSYTVNEVLHVR